MEEKMPRPNRLYELRENRDLKISEAAKEIGISMSSLSAWENDEDANFSVNSLKALAKYYNVSTDYILGLTDNKTETQTQIEELHLTDEAVQVIKSRNINTLLLSEIISHPAFRHMMIDAEIYVDRIAESQLQSVNAVLESIRRTFISEADADPEDLWMRSLKAGQIEETEYFGHVLHDDIMDILKDIREKHKPDRATADLSVASEMESALRETNIHSNPEREKQIQFLCSFLGIPQQKFSQEELNTFHSVMRSAKKIDFNTGTSLRGRHPASHGPRKGRGKNKKRNK